MTDKLSRINADGRGEIFYDFESIRGRVFDLLAQVPHDLKTGRISELVSVLEAEQGLSESQYRELIAWLYFPSPKGPHTLPRRIAGLTNRTPRQNQVLTAWLMFPGEGDARARQLALMDIELTPDESKELFQFANLAENRGRGVEGAKTHQ